MKISKNNYFLFTIFTIFLVYLFLLFLPNISFAVSYSTECGESFSIGTSHSICCRRECVERDEEGRCIRRECVERCTQYSCGIEWTEYRANTTECEPRIEKRKCRSVCGPGQNCCDCGPCQVECGSWKVCEECGSWQVAERECNCKVTKWGLNKPECICRGECIMVPEGLRFYNNPNYPTDPCEPEEGKDPYNLFLPIKNDWDDVQGWSGGWKEGNKCPIDTCLPEEEHCPYCPALKNQICHEYQECVQIYQIIIRGRKPTSEQKEKGIKKGEMRDCQALARIAESTKKKKEANLIRDFDKVNQYRQEIERIKEEELIITEYRVMIDYTEEKVTIEKVKEDGNTYKRVIKQGDLPECPLILLGRSEFIPFCPCFFKSHQTYELKIRACCNAPESNLFNNKHHPKNCGKWTEWQKFTTNHAPEPISPLDPDWVGKELIPDQPLEVELKWCDVYFEEERGGETIEVKPGSFKLVFYIGDSPGEEEKVIRHPWTKENNPSILSADRPNPLPRQKPQPVFRNPGFFTKPPFKYQGKEYNFYAWKVAACRGWRAEIECTNFSQKWRFSIEDTVLEVPTQISPPNDAEIPIGLPIYFDWNTILGAKSYILEIKREIDGELKVIKRETTALTSMVIDYPELQLDTLYYWRIKACRGFAGTECGEWSETYNLKTTGQAPKLIAPKGADIIIPTDFQWEKVPGAKSYVFRIQGPKLDLTKTTEEPKISLGFPNLRQEKTYSWQVKTCARPHGKLCGNWSSPQTFTTFKLSAPINPFPENNKEIHTYQMPKTFSWDPVLGAKYYKIIINQIKQKIVADNSMFVNFHKPGTYQWQVQACLDKNCEEAGNPVNWNFTLLAKEAPVGHRAGLVPCGRRYDNPNTKWNETAPCQIKHLFILLYIVLNFVLWTIIPLILVILVVVTGAMFYFSLSTGTTETIPKVKALWKSAGIGFGLIFLGWNIISFILTLFNYQLGPWYYIPI